MPIIVEPVSGKVMGFTSAQPIVHAHATYYLAVGQCISADGCILQ